jgi:hypothetical protein
VFKRLENGIFGTMLAGLSLAAPAVRINNLWMTCDQAVGRGWTQFLVFGPIPASVK